MVFEVGACAGIIPINLLAGYLQPDLAHAAGLRAFSHAWRLKFVLARGLVESRLNMFSKAHTYVFDCAAKAYVRGGG